MPKKSLKVQTLGQNAYTLCKCIIIFFNTLEKLRISLVMSECVRLYVCVSVCALPSIVRIEKKVMSANFMIIIGQLAKWQPGWVGATDHCAQADHSAQWFEKGCSKRGFNRSLPCNGNAKSLTRAWMCMHVHVCMSVSVCMYVNSRQAQQLYSNNNNNNNNEGNTITSLRFHGPATS